MGGHVIEQPWAVGPETARRRKGMALAAAAVAVLALGAGAALAGRTVTVGAGWNGNSVSLERGDTLVVRLAGNATTGYAWRIASAPRSLRKLGSSYLVRKTTPPLVGRGGTYVFRFAARPGHGTLRLIYQRPWEKRTPPLRTFTLRVSVA
jgi:inhibitor of cysteine peptidase